MAISPMPKLFLASSATLLFVLAVVASNPDEDCKDRMEIEREVSRCTNGIVGHRGVPRREFFADDDGEAGCRAMEEIHGKCFSEALRCMDLGEDLRDFVLVNFLEASERRQASVRECQVIKEWMEKRNIEWR